MRSVEAKYVRHNGCGLNLAGNIHSLAEHDIKAGVAWPSIFYHEASDSRILCHGDDFVILADEQGQQFIESVLAKKFEYRIDGCVGQLVQKLKTVQQWC